MANADRRTKEVLGSAPARNCNVRTSSLRRQGPIQRIAPNDYKYNTIRDMYAKSGAGVHSTYQSLVLPLPPPCLGCMGRPYSNIAPTARIDVSSIPGPTESLHTLTIGPPGVRSPNTVHVDSLRVVTAEPREPTKWGGIYE